MTFLVVVLLSLSQLTLVGGQVLLKHGMSRLGGPRKHVLKPLLGGMSLLTLWFLIWMSLLQRLDISYVFPFQGTGPVLMVLAAMLILHERVDGRTWLGVALIAAGTVLVALSAPS